MDVSQNNIRGNSDIGIYVSSSDNGSYNNNRIFDVGSDHTDSGSDEGIRNAGDNNDFRNNKVRGFGEPYNKVLEGRNKVIPGPQYFK